VGGNEDVLAISTAERAQEKPGVHSRRIGRDARPVSARRAADEASAKFISAKQLAERWALSPAATYKLLGSALRCMRVGGCVRVLLSDVEKFEADHLGFAP
jgi:hypothetical protein